MTKDETSISVKIEVPGAEQIGNAVETATDGAVKGLGAFLSRICLPAAQELGLLFADKVSGWRRINAMKIEAKAERLASMLEIPDNYHAHPRLTFMAVEGGSWAETDDVQDMWAGLLVSSMSAAGTDDDNLIFMNLLAQMTRLQCKLFNYGCVNSPKARSSQGFAVAYPYWILTSELSVISGCEDVHQIDFHFDHLRELGLLQSNAGIMADNPLSNITPSPLGLQFFARCNGFRGSAAEYFRKDIEAFEAQQVAAREAAQRAAEQQAAAPTPE